MLNIVKGQKLEYIGTQIKSPPLYLEIGYIAIYANILQNVGRQNKFRHFCVLFYIDRLLNFLLF